MHAHDRSFTTFPGDDIMSPGLVDDGTKCEEGKVQDFYLQYFNPSLIISCFQPGDFLKLV